MDASKYIELSMSSSSPEWATANALRAIALLLSEHYKESK